LEESDCVIEEGEPPYDVIFKSGPHFSDE
jgi:hypothetical protein